MNEKIVKSGFNTTLPCSDAKYISKGKTVMGIGRCCKMRKMKLKFHF